MYMSITFDDTLISGKLKDLHADEEEVLMKALSDKYGLPYADLRQMAPEPDALRLVSKEDCEKSLVAPFKLIGNKIYLAVHSPMHPDLPSVVSSLKTKGYTPTIFLVSTSSLNHIWLRYGDLSRGEKVESGEISLTSERLDEIMNGFTSFDTFVSYIDGLTKQDILYKTTKVIEVMVAGAIKLKASDIHIEPEEDKVRLRYRIHGVLKDVIFLEQALLKQLTSRLKILSGLKLSTTSKSQDGRFSIQYGDVQIEMRVSVVPGNYGESFVMRILDPRNSAANFDTLNVNDITREKLELALKKPHGVVLTTGPTGSGKSTTLYGFLKKIYNPEVKIITIEDPIEYHFEGITQTQVNEEKEYTFLSGLRSALRQDPDVIMVGEIRDEDTAKVAVNASLTGHLVLSTLHTNTAAGAIPRLVELGVNPKTLASALNAVIAQRLVRTLCPCKIKRLATKKEATTIKNTLASMVINKKDNQLAGFVVSDSYEIYGPGNCDECDDGYNGRTGIFEVMTMTPQIEVILVTNPSEREIRDAMTNQGVITLKEDAILKVLRGETSYEEVEKVVDLYSE